MATKSPELPEIPDTRPVTFGKLSPQIVALGKQEQLEKMMLRGVESTAEAASILGLSNYQTTDLKRLILAQWRENHEKYDNEDFRIKRVMQFDNIGRLALEEFERSKETQVETTVQWRKCECCHGSGIDPEGVTIPKKIREAVMERDEFKCQICDAESNLTLDHIIPRSKGGSHAISNLRVLCFTCNRIKSNKLDPESQCSNCYGEGEEEILPGQMKLCEVCHGTGAKPDIPLCLTCSGSGRIEQHTTKTSERTGNAAYLTVAKAAFAEAAKVEGIYPQGTKSAFHTLFAETKLVGGKLQQSVEEIFVIEDTDLIVQGLAFLDKYELAKKAQEKQKKAEAIECQPSNQVDVV